MPSVDQNTFINSYNPILSNGILPYDYEKYLKDDSIPGNADPMRCKALDEGPLQHFDSITLSKNTEKCEEKEGKTKHKSLLGIVAMAVAAMTGICIFRKPVSKILIGTAKFLENGIKHIFKRPSV